MPATNPALNITWLQLRWWVALCGLMGFAALAAPYFIGCFYTADDLLAYHLPLRQFYAECLAQGDSFLWWPALFCGHYVHGEGQGGFFHPWHLALYGLFPLRSAMGLEILLSYPLLMLGTAIFLRRHMSSTAAAFGAIVFGFSGFSLLHLMHVNAIAVVAHIPWLLVAIDVRLRTRSRKTAVACDLAITLLTTSQLLLGYPQYVWISLLVEAGYVAWFATYVENRRGVIASLALSKLLGFVLGAVQLFPSYEALRESTRQSASRFSAQGSLHPLNLVQFVAPYLLLNRVVGENTHELGLYIGAVPLLLTVWYIFSPKPHSGRLLGRSATWLLAAALLLALGTYGPLYQFQTWLPVVGSFRFPSRYIVLVHLAIAILAALGFAQLWRSSRQTAQQGPHQAALQSIWVIVALAALIPLVTMAELLAQQRASWPLVLVGPALFITGGLLITAAYRGHRVAFVLLAIFTTADLLAYGLSYSVYPHVQSPAQLLAALPHPPVTESVSVVLPPPPENLHQRVGNGVLLRGYARIDGYAGLEPSRLLDYRDEAVLRLAGAQWQRVPRYSGSSSDQWQPVPATLPRARLLSRARLTERPSALLAELDLSEEAAIARPISNLAGPAGMVEVLSDRPGAIQLTTDAAGEQLLVLTERFHPGWIAQLDGQPLSTERVNGDFLGCVVPAGTHKISLRFVPWSYQWGLWVSAVGAIFILLRFAWGLSRAIDGCMRNLTED